MNTPSHLIVAAALRKSLRRRVPIIKSAFLIGSVAPDIPLYLLTLGGFIYYQRILGWSERATFRYMFDTLFFNDPFWIATHNALHAPTTLVILLAALWPFRQRLDSPFRWWFWFVAGCMLHTALDIPTHVDDGPLLFFPFEWTTRYSSPVSYWDDRYFGREFAMFELTLDSILLGYLFGPPIWRRLTRRKQAASAEIH